VLAPIGTSDVGFDHKIADRPLAVVEKEVPDVADLPIAGAQFEAFEIFGVSQHGRAR
jgi:hypothetical protein